MNNTYDRDYVIFKLVKAGVSYEVLFKKFGIGKARLQQIYRDQLYKTRHGNPDIPEIDIMCRTLGLREQERGMIQSTLHKHGYTASDDSWRKLSYDDICRIERLGPNSACVIWLAQNM